MIRSKNVFLLSRKIQNKFIEITVTNNCIQDIESLFHFEIFKCFYSTKVEF